jgi:1-acyl-sn-glycerol-3-phosphate acyltransferase
VTASGKPSVPFAYRFVVAVVRPLLMLLTKRDWRGAENLPRSGGFVVAPNHLSHLDPLVFGHFMYDNGWAPFFLGKEEVFRVPVVGAILRGARQIPVYRNTGQAADAFRAAVAAIHAGKCVGVYPEGTLTRDPELWPMVGKTGAARIALATKCPVIPVAQWGPQTILAPYSKRPRLFPRKTMHVSAGPPVDLTDLYDKPLTGAVLRQATDRIMAALTAQLEQIRGEQAPIERFDPRKHGLPQTGNFRRAKPGSSQTGEGGRR